VNNDMQELLQEWFERVTKLERRIETLERNERFREEQPEAVAKPGEKGSRWWKRGSIL
jgi:chaperonin cofactor prefoldin